jgi:hypothetical protein
VSATASFEVTVTLRNPPGKGGEPSLCALVPSFFFELEPNSEGYPVVLFEVVSPAGAKLKPTKARFAIPVRPSLESFRYLAPGQFFGDTISLNDPPFGFDTQAPGTYRITATLTTAARDYFVTTSKRMKGKTWSHIDPKDVFQGQLRSNTVEVAVK